MSLVQILAPTAESLAGGLAGATLPDPRWLGDGGVPDLVSVIVPTFDRAGMILELLDNLAGQDWPAIEIVVVDDGSSDDTRNAVLRWSAANPSPPVILLSQANRGPGSARNLGLTAARGEFVYFIDSDDFVLPHALRRMIERIRSTGRPYCVAGIVSQRGRGTTASGDTLIMPRMRPGNVIGSGWMTHGALYRRAAVNNAGLYHADLRLGEDTEYHWRIVATNGPGAVLHEAVGIRSEHDSGHLSVGADPGSVWRAGVTALRCHLAWADAEQSLSRRSARSLAQCTLVAGVWLASLGEMAEGRRAFRMFPELRRHGPWWVPALSVLTAPRGRAYYRLLRVVLTLGMGVRSLLPRMLAIRLRERSALARARRAHPGVGYSPTAQMQ